MVILTTVIEPLTAKILAQMSEANFLQKLIKDF